MDPAPFDRVIVAPSQFVALATRLACIGVGPYVGFDLGAFDPDVRYSIGDRTPGIRFGENGSLAIRIQRQDPGADLAPNWLPAPEGAFTLIARAYIPQAPLLDGRYRFPPVVRVDR